MISWILGYDAVTFSQPFIIKIGYKFSAVESIWTELILCYLCKPTSFKLPLLPGQYNLMYTV